jgi:hypothetical protein
VRKEYGAVLHVDLGEVTFAHPVMQLDEKNRQIVLVQSEDGADAFDDAFHVRKAGPQQLGKIEFSMLYRQEDNAHDYEREQQ